MADPNLVVARPLQQGQVVVPHVADIKIDSRPAVIPGQAPASLSAIADLGDIFEKPPAAAILRTLTLAPDDPLPEEPAE